MEDHPRMDGQEWVDSKYTVTRHGGLHIDPKDTDTNFLNLNTCLYSFRQVDFQHWA